MANCVIKYLTSEKSFRSWSILEPKIQRSRSMGTSWLFYSLMCQASLFCKLVSQYVLLSTADPDFNPFVDLQAQARAHRLGQENVVLVYQLITKFSVEEKIIERSRQKLAMENLVMSSSDKSTAEDVNTLLLHGARKVLEEQDVDATSVKWTNENLELLMSRDISETKDVKEGGAGYLGAVQEPEGILGGLPVDRSPLKSGREWDDLLGKLAEQDMEAEEAKLGRGKRQRRKIQYSFEPNINAHEDKEEARDAVEDDPSCSGESSSLSGSDSDVSLDDEKGRGSRGPYLSKIKSIKNAQGVSLPVSQHHPGQGSYQLPSSSPVFNPPLTSPKHLRPSKVVPPPSYLPLYTNQPSSKLPTYGSPPLSSWPTPFPPSNLIAVSSCSQHRGVNHFPLRGPHPQAWSDMSASPGSFQGSKPFWEYSAPRIHGSSTASVSTSQTFQTLHSPLSSPREHLNPARTQVHGSPMPYHTAASHNVSERLSPKDLKVGPTSISTQHCTSPNALKVTSASKWTKEGTSPKALKVASTLLSVQQGTRSPSSSAGPTEVPEVDRKHLSSPLGPVKNSLIAGPNVAHFPMPKSHSLPFTTNERPGDVAAHQFNRPDDAILQRGFLQQSKEQSCPPDYLSLAEVLRRTGSQLSGSQASPTSKVLQDAKGLSLEEVLRKTGSTLSGSQASPGPKVLQDAKDLSLQDVLRQTGSPLSGTSPALNVLRDAKGLSLEDVLRQTGSMLTASKHVLTAGTPSQLFEEAKNMSLEDVLRRTGATNIRMDDAYKRTGSTAPETPSLLLQDSTNMSLEEVLRQTGSKLIAPKKAVLPKPPVLEKNAPELRGPLGVLNQKESSSTESKQAKSAVLPPSSQVSLDAKSNSSDAVSQQSVDTRTGTKQAVYSLDAKSNSSEAVSPNCSPIFSRTKHVVSSKSAYQVLSETQLTLSNQPSLLRPKVEPECEVQESGGKPSRPTRLPARGNS